MLDEIIRNALAEDIGSGDHSSLSCLTEDAQGSAELKIKDSGIIAGVELAQRIYDIYDPSLKMDLLIKDGSEVSSGDIGFRIHGKAQSILSTERVVLNFMQRMSGIATKTHRMVELIGNNQTKLLDTRKTTPGIRELEKWAVRIGGGFNHRFGLYDMIMLKDNHIDFAGGIRAAIDQANAYIRKKGLDLRIEIEVRNESELKEVLNTGGVHRIMLDNFTAESISAVLDMIPDDYEVEASGGITEDSIKSFADVGVDFISVGAVTHSFKSLDMSLKAELY